MNNVFDLTQKFPEDWNDETKYPNKKLIYQTPEKDYMTKIVKSKKSEDRSFIDEENIVYHGLIYELWEYDCPANTITGKWILMVAKCPKCGSYEFKKEKYDNLCPEALAGSAGIHYTCENCGYKYTNVQIQS